MQHDTQARYKAMKLLKISAKLFPEVVWNLIRSTRADCNKDGGLVIENVEYPFVECLIL